MTTRDYPSDGTGDSVSRRSFIAGAPIAASGLALTAASLPETAQADEGKFWPNGARLAIAFSLVIETGADPDPVIAGPEGKKFPDLYGQTENQYAAREGIPRLLDMFDRRRIKVTSFICGQSAARFPDLAKEIAARGHECAAHGREHEVQFQLARDDERAFIQGAVDMVSKATGQTPLGYNCRQQRRSVNTLSLLQEMGFLYHIDDVSRDEPFIVPVNGKPFVVVPYTQHLTDISYFNGNHGAVDGFAQELKYEFDALYAEAVRRRRMMVVTFHDAVARPGRVKVMEEFITQAQRQPGVWFARTDALAHWSLKSPLTIKESVAT